MNEYNYGMNISCIFLKTPLEGKNSQNIKLDQFT